ncbi:MAG: hypothetical protein KJ732_00385, partial [Candidatus Margulisbacteria bacterium]|nr:hypothetical protein [Candidatus Margulisiibacteriota bacterium]
MDKRISKIKIFLLFALLIYFAFLIFNAAVTIVFPYPVDYAEGISLDRVCKISQWRWDGIYDDIAQYPYLS